MKKTLLILFSLILIFSFSNTFAIQGKILSINKDKNTVLIKEEKKLNFFERILSFFNLKKEDPNIYEIKLNSEKINKVNSFLFFSNTKKEEKEKLNVGDTINISNVFENVPKQEEPKYTTTDKNVDFINVFSGFEPTNIDRYEKQSTTTAILIKQSDRTGVMVTSKPSLDSKTECTSNKDCMFCNGACISLIKTSDISYCNTIAPNNLSCVCLKGYCVKQKATENYVISEETKHCSFREAPVCGVNGTTYLNECFAKAANVEIECNKSCPCNNATTITQTTTTQTTTTQTTTTINPTTTITIPQEAVNELKEICEVFNGVWYEEYQECQKTNLEEMEEFESWCTENNGFFTNNIPCPEGKICLAVVTAGCSFSKPYPTTTTTTTKPYIYCKTDDSCPDFNQKFCEPGYMCFFKCVDNKCVLQKKPIDSNTTSTTLPKIPWNPDFKCTDNSDCLKFKEQECPDREGIECQYECLDDHCVWIIKDTNEPTTTTSITTTTIDNSIIIPPLPQYPKTPTYPENPIKEVCPKIGNNIPCFNDNDCEIQLSHLLNEKGDYVGSNCIPRCIYGKCQILDLGVDYPVDVLPPNVESPTLPEDIYSDYLSLKKIFKNIYANIFNLK